MTSPLPTLLGLGVLTLLGCQSLPRRLESVPSALEGRVALARAASLELKKTLSARLVSAVQASGPAAGLEVCAAEAATLTAGVASRQGLELGRTSHRLRNPRGNAPRPWVRAYLAELSGLPAKDVAAAVYDLGDRLGVVEPLPTQALCLVCHGAGAALPPEVKRVLAERYPDDQAIGFAEGDVRGVVWVEVTKSLDR